MRPLHAGKGSVQFRYVGATSLIVEGPISGRRYFFGAPGAVLAIDPRDSPSMAGVPTLRPL